MSFGDAAKSAPKPTSKPTPVVPTPPANTIAGVTATPPAYTPTLGRDSVIMGGFERPSSSPAISNAYGASHKHTAPRRNLIGG